MIDITTKLLLKTAAKAGREDAVNGRKRRVYDSLRPIIQEAYNLAYEDNEGYFAHLIENRHRDVDISDIRGVCRL